MTSDRPNQYSRGYSGGQYVIRIPSTGGSSPAVAGAPLPGTYTDASVSVSASLVNPAGDQLIAVGCRAQGANSGYRFLIVPASGVTLAVRGGQPLAIMGLLSIYQTSPAIHTGVEPNQLQLECHGSTIDASINGRQVASVHDYTFRSGQMWIEVGKMPSPVPVLPGEAGQPPLSTPAGGAVEGHFSNLVVTQLAP